MNALEGLRVGLHRMSRALQAPTRTPRLAVVLGRLLGIAFLLCFATGLYSHALQDPADWMVFPTRPVWLYQVTQGIHITAGIVCFPLLLAKLHVIFPALFQTPPIRSFAHALERASIALFVSASLVQITIGLLNTYQFYSLFPFSFRDTHFVLSFVVIGSLAIHIGVKLPVIVEHWRRGDRDADGGAGPGAAAGTTGESDEPSVDDEAPVVDTAGTGDRVPDEPRPTGVVGRIMAWIDRTPEARHSGNDARASRRVFLGTTGVTAAVLVLFTAGQSFRVLDPINLFAPRKNGVGPQGLPVNRTAKAADVVELATAADWSLSIVHGSTTRTIGYEELSSMPQHEAFLPIACVEGWSQYALWRGVRLADLLALVEAPGGRDIRVTSLQTNSSYGVTTMQAEFVPDDLTLVALQLEGEVLDLDHGFPARIIAPARPGVLQTKWLSSLEVLE